MNKVRGEQPSYFYVIDQKAKENSVLILLDCYIECANAHYLCCIVEASINSITWLM